MTPEREHLKALIDAQNAAWKTLCNLSATPEGAALLAELKAAVDAKLKTRGNKVAKVIPVWRTGQGDAGTLENFDRVIKALGGVDVWFELRGSIKARAKKLEAAAAQAHREAKEAANKYAATLSPMPGTQRLLLRAVWISSYSTQGFGAASYARNEAKICAGEAEARSVRAEIVATERGFEVWALVEDPIDIEILKRAPGLPLREWVRRCWKHGANPRVYHPSLPHGYEEANGLDFFGNDLRAAGKETPPQ